MKKLMLFMTMLSGSALAGQAQEGLSEITQIVAQFTTAGDQQDADALSELLHPNYRVVWNNPEKGTVTVLDRDTYIRMIRDKKLGGDQRTLQIQSVEMIDGGNALVRTTMQGAKADFQSLFSLVKNDQGKWRLVQDQVFMAMK